MKYSLLAVGFLLVSAPSAPANTPAYAHCGTYDSYILLCKSIQKFEELGKLHCGETVQITAQEGEYSQVQTTDGRLGWVPTSDLSLTAPPPQQLFTFGWTEKPKSEPKSEPRSEPKPEPAPPTNTEQPTSQPSAQAPAPGTVQTVTTLADQPSERPVVARSSESAPLLTNVNVMKMQGAHLSPDAIITRINSSRCDFDTAPVALHRLKLSGVSDRIILAMMHAPPAFPALPPDSASSVEVQIPSQTPVQVALSGDVSSSDLQEGSVVEMTVVEPVALNGVTLIPQGAEARARIMAVRRSSLGSSGQVVWFMEDVTSATGDRVPASFAATQDATVAIGRFAGYPFFLTEYHKGAPAIAASSDHYIAFVDGNISVRVARPLTPEQSASKLQTQPQVTPQVVPTESAPAGFPAIVQAPDPVPAVKP